MYLRLRYADGIDGDEDKLQEVVLLYSGLSSKWNPERGSFLALWASAMENLKRKWRHICIRRAKECALDEDVFQLGYMPNFEEKLDVEMFLERLSPPSRRALELKMSGYSAQEISALGLSLSDARKEAKRELRRLRCQYQ